MVFQFIARIILRNRLFVLIAVGLVTVFMAYMVTTLKFYYEPTPLLPKNDSLLIQYRELTKTFGKGENIMVVGVEDSSFFSAQNFSKWRKLEEIGRASCRERV